MRRPHALISAFALLALAGCTTPNSGGYSGGSGSYAAPPGGQPALGGQSTQTSAGITTSYQGGANPIVRVVAVDARQVQRVEIIGPSGTAIPANLSMHREDMADPNRQMAQANPGGYGGPYGGGYSPYSYGGGYFANSFSVGFGSASGVHVGVGLMMPMIMAAMAATGPRPHPVYGYGAPPSAGGPGGAMTRTTANLILDDPRAYSRVWQNSRIRVRYEGGQTEEVAAPAPG
jgi:hypothetical protein